METGSKLGIRIKSSYVSDESFSDMGKNKPPQSLASINHAKYFGGAKNKHKMGRGVRQTTTRCCVSFWHRPVPKNAGWDMSAGTVLIVRHYLLFVPALLRCQMEEKSLMLYTILHDAQIVKS